MKLQELVSKVSFEELKPYLCKVLADTEEKDVLERRLSELFAFREAYDIFKRLEPKTPGEDSAFIELHWRGKNREYDDEKPYISVWSPAQEEWSKELSKEIILKDDLQSMPLAEQMARILWEETFWGFDPDERPSFFDPDEYDLPLNLQLNEIKRKQRKLEVPKRFRKTLPNGLDNYPIFLNNPKGEKDFNRFAHRKKNRRKRKRLYILEQREIELETRLHRDRIIKFLTTDSTFERKDVEYLLDVESGLQTGFVSRCKNSDLHLQEKDNIIFLVITSSDYPLQTTDKELIERFIKKHIGAKTTYKIGYATNDILRRDLKIDIFINNLKK